VDKHFAEHPLDFFFVAVESAPEPKPPNISVQLLVDKRAAHHKGVEPGELDVARVAYIDRVDVEHGNLAVLAVVVCYFDDLHHGVVAVRHKVGRLDIEIVISGLMFEVAEAVGRLQLLLLVHNRVPGI
jgi:hypothetical protein